MEKVSRLAAVFRVGSRSSRYPASSLLPGYESSDEILMEAYRDHGQADQFQIIYERYKRPLLNFLRRQCDAALSDEIFQETWTTVIHHRQSYRSQGKFSSWLFNIAHNKLIDHHRRPEFRFARLSMDDLTEEPVQAPGHGSDPAHDLEREQRQQNLMLAMNELPFHQREAVLLQQQGFSLEDIADITDTSFETIKSRLRYAFQKLRQHWESARENHHD